MFSGQRFDTLSKQGAALATGFHPNVLDDHERSVADYVNALDRYAYQYGYEFHCFTEKTVIFKKVRA